MAHNPAIRQLTPLRAARAESVLSYIGFHTSEHKVSCDVADVVRHFAPDVASIPEQYAGATARYAWTRHEVDTALNDLARHGYIRIHPDIISMEIEVRRATWGGKHE